MNTNLQKEYKHNSFIFKRLSIQQRLPLFILIILLTVVVTFGWISYLQVRTTALAMGTERVTTLADKLSSIFQRSIDQFGTSAKKIADEKKVIDYFKYRTVQDSVQALDLLMTFGKKDTSNKLIQLLDTKKQPILSWSKSQIALTTNIDSSNAVPLGRGGYVAVGKIIQIKGLMYFPCLARVRDHNKIIGFVVEWKILRATQESIDQLAQILGSKGKVYFGNDDNEFWTNLLKPVRKPPVDIKKLKQTLQYSRDNGEPLIGTARTLTNSRWLVLVELSSDRVLKTTRSFLIVVVVVGSLLVFLGSLGGWLVSRTITMPLKQLSNAASSFSDGNYSQKVNYNNQDELGKLANSFNNMAAKIQSWQQNLEREVEDKTKKLENAQTDIKIQDETIKRKDEFINMASHELKTPLTTIKAFFQIAAQEIPSEYKSFKLIPKASRQVSRMERLIADLLDASRINLHNINYNDVIFDFDQVLKEAVNTMQHASPKHELIITKSVSVKINGDPIRIEQAMSNILDNAVKFSAEASQVTICSELQRNMIVIEIKDSGIGIAEEMMDTLFERFSRANTDPRFQGLGLGLFISSQIIKAHKGTIAVHSVLGKGSEFIIQLPIARSIKSHL
jgi:signal transduction histidine kinase